MEAPRRSIRSRTTNTRLNGTEDFLIQKLILGYVEMPSAGTARGVSVADRSVARRQLSSAPEQQQPGMLRPSNAPAAQLTGILGPLSQPTQPGTLSSSSPASSNGGVGTNPSVIQAGIVGTLDRAEDGAVENIPSLTSQELDTGEDLLDLAEDLVDFSDDEEQARREFEAENAPHLRRNRSVRFKIKNAVPGADNKSHLDIVVREVEQMMMTYQVKIGQVNWMGIARNVRLSYPQSFPGRGGELKDPTNVSKLCRNGLKKAVREFKKKLAIMGRSGNSGPPDTELEICLRNIISIDDSALATRRVAPSGRRSRPAMLDRQPIATGSIRMPLPSIPVEQHTQPGHAPPGDGQAHGAPGQVPAGHSQAAGYGQVAAGHGQVSAGHSQVSAGHSQATGYGQTLGLNSRIPLSDLERSQAAAALNLDEPMTSYRQQRNAMASQGQELRESSLAEMHTRTEQQRRRSSTTELRAAGSSAIEGANSTIQAMASQKSSIEHLVFNNMELRREERDQDREERRRNAAIEKEEREERARVEKEERERREIREERRLALEKEEKDRKDMLLFKLIGISSRTESRQVTVQAVQEDFESQPFPIRLILTTLMDLKKELCEYMGLREVAGIVLQDGGEPFILTDVDQLQAEKYDVLNVLKRGKSYISMTVV